MISIHPFSLEHWVIIQRLKVFKDWNKNSNKKKPGYSLLIAGLTIRLLDSLSNSSQFKIESIKTQSSNSNELSELIKQYIDNKKQKISYDELSHTFGYNGKYLNRVFKKKFWCFYSCLYN